MRANVAEIEMDEKVVVLIDKETQSQGPLLPASYRWLVSSRDFLGQCCWDY